MMDSYNSFPYHDIHPLRTHSGISPRTRVGSAFIVMLLHCAFLVIFILVRENPISGPNALSEADSGSLVSISLMSEQQTQPGSTSRILPHTNAANTPSQKRPLQKLPETASITPVPSDNVSAGSAASQTFTLSLPTDGRNAGIISEFQRQLFAHIETYRQYPLAARRARIQGTVELMFAMDRNGIVLGVWIKRSSGYPVLDKEAVATVLRAQPLPAIPAKLPDPLNITLPVSFGSVD
jgi:periplasmic protein TonB